MNKYNKLLVAALFGAFAFLASAHATVPAGLDTLTSDVTTYRATIWDFVIASVAFGVIIAWASKLKGKKG